MITKNISMIIRIWITNYIIILFSRLSGILGHRNLIDYNCNSNNATKLVT